MQRIMDLTVILLSLTTKNPDQRCSSIDRKDLFLDRTLFTPTNVKSSGALDVIAQYCICGFNFRLDSNGDGQLSFNTSERWSQYPQIPYVVHQTWKTNDTSMHSPHAKTSRASIRRFANDFLYVLWTDEDILHLVDSRYAEYSIYYRGLNMNIKRSDIARYFIVHAYGGLYMDLDVELRGPATLILRPPSAATLNAPLQLVSYRSKEFKKAHFVGNAIFAAVPNSTIFLFMYRYVQLHTKQDGKTTDQVLKHTGPFALAGAALAYSQYQQQQLPRLDDWYSGRSFERSRTIYLHSSDSIGNYYDFPQIAVHRRAHRWDGEQRS
jgi:hypothetical protein